MLGNPPRTHSSVPRGGKPERAYLSQSEGQGRAVQALLAVDPWNVTQTQTHMGFESTAHNAVTTLISLLDKSWSPTYILETDVEKCFEQFSHEYLMRTTPICDRAVLAQWLKAGVEYLGEVEYPESGTPQGGVISPLLCNVALNGMEGILKGAVKGKVRTTRKYT